MHPQRHRGKNAGGGGVHEWGFRQPDGRRNGIFYDRKGRDWDATITKILDNPISIRQAFWAPYKKAARMIQEQIAKRAANADQAAAAKLAQAAAKLEQAGTTGASPAAGAEKSIPA